jgi:prepilin-type N-terminal cleavage/methylation domain-containing protein
MGFSLVEMLVVVSMIGLMSLFAWPKVIAVHNQSQVRSARTAVRNLFEATRINARMNSSRMHLNRDGDTFWVTNAAGTVVGTYLNVGGEYKVSTTGPTLVGIDPRGLTQGSRTFVFSRGNAADSMVISGFGTVTR